MSTIDPRLLTTGGAAANETRDETEGDDKGTDDSEGDSGDDNEEGRYKVEKIKDYEVYEIEKEPVSIEEDRYVVLYRVKWEGYDNPKDDTWEPKGNFDKEEDWEGFMRDCERTKPAHKSHDAIVEKARRMNDSDRQERIKAEEEKEKLQKLEVQKKTTSSSSSSSGKKSRDSQAADSPASTSTSSSKKARNAPPPPAPPVSKPRVSTASHNLSSVEIRRLRAQSINQEALNNLVMSTENKEIQALRITPPPQPKSKSRKGKGSKSGGRNEAGQFEKRGTTDKGKGKEIIPDSESTISTAGDEGSERSKVNSIKKKSGFASDSDDEDEQESNSILHDIKPIIETSDQPTSRPGPSKGFASEDDDEQDADPIESNPPPPPPVPSNSSLPLQSTAVNASKSIGFAEEEGEEEEGEGDDSLALHRAGDISRSAAPSASVAAKTRSGFAQDDDDEEDEEQTGGQLVDNTRLLPSRPTGTTLAAPIQHSESPSLTSQPRSLPPRPSGFAKDSDDDQDEAESMALDSVESERRIGDDSGFGNSSLTAAPGFALDSDSDEAAVESQVKLEISNPPPQRVPPKQTGWAADSEEEEEEEVVAAKETEHARSNELEKVGSDSEMEIIEAEAKEGTGEGVGKQKEKKQGKEKKRIAQAAGQGTAGTTTSKQTSKIDISDSTKPIKKQKRAAAEKGRESPPPAKKKKQRKSVVEDDEEDSGPPQQVVQTKAVSREDALKKLKIGRVSKDGSANRPSSGNQRSPSVVTNSATDQHSNSHGSGNNKRQEEDPFNYGKQRSTSKDGYILINASVLQFKKLPEAIAGKENPNWPVGALDHERIRWWWKIGKNPVDNFVDFDRILSYREVYVTAPPTQREIGTSKKAAAHEKDYLALQLVLAHVPGVKQADSLRSDVSAVFVHASLATDLGRFPGKFTELDRLRERDDVVCFFYGTGDDNRRALRRFWKPLTAITFTASALIDEPSRLGQLVESASSSQAHFDGSRNQFPFMLPQYLLPGGALGTAVDEHEKPISRSLAKIAELRPALETVYSLILRSSLPLTSLAPSLDVSRLDQNQFPAFSDRTPSDPVVWMKLSQCYKPRFCNVSLERLQKLVCTFRSQYSSIRRWIIIATREEINSLGPAPGVVLATLEEAQKLLDEPLASIVG